jgi:hypothetical protein
LPAFERHAIVPPFGGATMRTEFLLLVMMLGAASPSGAQVFPTPQWIAWCERAISDLTLRAKPYSEEEAKSAVMMLYSCDERRLLDRTTKLILKESELNPYYEAYAADPLVWRKKK